MANIVDTLAQAGNFTILISALNKTGLADALKGSGPFTVFAPTDDAFNRLPAGMFDNLLNNQTQLRDVLMYHVLSGSITSEDIKKQNIRSVRSLQGENVTIDVSLLGQLQIDNATVTRADILADNGVIQTINDVLIPSTMRRQRAA